MECPQLSDRLLAVPSLQKSYRRALPSLRKRHHASVRAEQMRCAHCLCGRNEQSFQVAWSIADAIMEVPTSAV